MKNDEFSMRPQTALQLSLVLAGLLVSAYFYPVLPETMASHWNLEGQPDGFLPKGIAAFLLPVLAAFLLLVFKAIPFLDPLKENIAAFRSHYDRFVALLLAFLLYVHLLSVAWNVGYRFGFALALLPAFSLLFFFLGTLFGHAKRNWFIGIRTPWTLSSDPVWENTHRLGAKLFKIAAFLSLTGLLFPSLALYFLFFPVMAAALACVVYSYFDFRRLKK